MSKELTPQELRGWLDKEIHGLKKGMESAKNFGWPGRMAVQEEMLRRYDIFLRLIEKAEEWKKRAWGIRRDVFKYGWINAAPDDFLNELCDFDPFKEKP